MFSSSIAMSQRTPSHLPAIATSSAMRALCSSGPQAGIGAYISYRGRIAPNRAERGDGTQNGLEQVWHTAHATDQIALGTDAASSIEFGGGVLSGRWHIEPQVQAIYQTLGLNNATDVVSSVNFNTNGSFVIRAACG
jgi:hypothetical protein